MSLHGKHSVILAITIIASLLLIGGTKLSAEWVFDLEGGAVFNGYNDVRIPNETGTEISLVEDLSAESRFFFRGRLSYVIDDRHTISVFAAPLRINADGRVDQQVVFEDSSFEAGSQLKAVYRFDSYRVTYRYRLYDRPDLKIGLGFTAKLRDAAISLQSGDKFEEKTNTGFVPLINFMLDWSFSDRLGLLLEGDALAAPQGRAEDVLLALRYDLTGRVALKTGYRILEGGADVDEVYNFALLHYLSAGVIISF